MIWLHVLWCIVVEWFAGPDDEPIRKHCPGCGRKRPKDPFLWERWEFEHEEHEAMPW